jgi:hypothetical protein
MTPTASLAVNPDRREPREWANGAVAGPTDHAAGTIVAAEHAAKRIPPRELAWSRLKTAGDKGKRTW